MIDWYQETETVLEAVEQLASELPAGAWLPGSYEEFCKEPESPGLRQHLETAWAEYQQVAVDESEVDRRTYVTNRILKQARDSWRAALSGQLDKEESREQAEWASRLLAALATL